MRILGNVCIAALLSATCIACGGSPSGAPVTTYKQVYTAYYGTPPTPVATFSFVQVFNFGAYPESKLILTITNVWPGAPEALCFDYIGWITDGSRGSQLAGALGALEPGQSTFPFNEGSIPIVISSANIRISLNPNPPSTSIFCS
jgi:hypothetical protein